MKYYAIHRKLFNLDLNLNDPITFYMYRAISDIFDLIVITHE